MSDLFDTPFEDEDEGARASQARGAGTSHVATRMPLRPARS